MNERFAITDFDRKFWADELETFVPDKVFDAHTHIWSDAHAGAESAPSLLRTEVDYAEMNRFAQAVFPGRKVGFLMLGTPIVGLDLAGHNEFIAGEIAKSPLHLGSALVTPWMSAEELDTLLSGGSFTGLKPYRSFADDPANARITDYLPERLLEVADSHNMVITLHMSRFDGIADPVNVEDLHYLTSHYPNVRWILAHCARGFNSFTLEKSIFELRDIPNIWYDTSAVCDVRSHYLLFKYESIDRIMFGTDNIAAGGDHGKYIVWGRGWQFFKAGELPHCLSDSTFVFYEQLRAQKQAADMAGLTTGEIEKLFSQNAENFFGFKF